jgi:phenylpropionate dioxygenase-like ring-hydroxylating dioxygenase large terminal subunit
MIPNQWYPVLQSSRLGRRPKALRRMGEDLVLWRDHTGRAICLRDRCPHRGASLSRGRVRDGQIECPYHGFRFEAGGACSLMPCEGAGAHIPAGLRVEPFATREDHGLVWLFWGDPALAPPEVPWFDEFAGGVAGAASGSFDWPLNYVRTIESNFDVHHFRFVHGSVMPGVGTVVDPYEVEVAGGWIKTRGELRREGRSQGIRFRVEFKLPSVSLLEFGSLVFLVADCPIDEQNTWRFARYRQSYVSLPGLGWLVSWLSLQLDWRLFQARQDLKVARTQRPRLPDQQIDHLVRADGGTAAYLKLRRKLLREARGGATRQASAEAVAAGRVVPTS